MGSGKSSLLYESMTDEELLALASAGDLQAEETMIRRYSRVVRTLARPFFLTGGDQEDLLQEGMLGLLSALRGYDAGKNASFRTFAMLCIRRRLISAVDDCLSLESSLFDELSSRNDNMRGPEELLIDREEAQKRYQSLLQLLSAFEQSVLRCFLRGMSYREIAKTTKSSEKAVDNAVQRIRRKFQKLDPGDTSFG